MPFCLMIGQLRCWQATVSSNFRSAIVEEYQKVHDLQVVDCKGTKNLIQGVALEGTRKMKVM
jgi:hypothetical protein